jgi:DNA end-binding protein Ku
MLRFGLVAFPVEAVNAHLREEGAVAFHQLHAECGRRIHYVKTCPVHGAVGNDEIVSGYEFAKGKYVEVEPEELDELRTEKERALTLDAFIEPDELDPLYYDGRMYYLRPDGDAATEPYSVLTAALKSDGRYGVGQVVFSGKQQVVLIRPYDNVLQMALLNYSAEMLDPARLHLSLPEVKPSDRRVRMAEQIIQTWSKDDFDFRDYVDRHLADVRRLIEAKMKGKKIVKPEDEEEPEVINLMEALEKSIAEHRRGAKGVGKSRSRSSARSRRRRRAS